MTEKTISILKAVAVILVFLIVFGSAYFVFWVNKQLSDLRDEVNVHQQVLRQIVNLINQSQKQ